MHLRLAWIQNSSQLRVVEEVSNIHDAGIEIYTISTLTGFKTNDRVDFLWQDGVGPDICTVVTVIDVGFSLEPVCCKYQIRKK